MIKFKNIRWLLLSVLVGCSSNKLPKSDPHALVPKPVIRATDLEDLNGPVESSRYVYMWISDEFKVAGNNNMNNRYLVIRD